MVKIEALDAEAFGTFGFVVAARQDRFQPLMEFPDAAGWQIAVNRVVDRAVLRVHRHLDTAESFAPLAGTAVLVVAPPRAPEACRAFLLDRAVCVNAGVWHATVCLSARAEIQIAEGRNPVSEAHPLPAPLQVVLAPAR